MTLEPWMPRSPRKTPVAVMPAYRVTLARRGTAGAWMLPLQQILERVTPLARQMPRHQGQTPAT